MRLNVFLHFVFAVSVGLVIGVIYLPPECYVWMTAGGYFLFFLWAWLFLIFGTTRKFIVFEIILGCLIVMVTGGEFTKTAVNILEYKIKIEESVLVTITSCFLYVVLLFIVLCPLVNMWRHEKRKGEVLSQA